MSAGLSGKKADFLGPEHGENKGRGGAQAVQASHVAEHPAGEGKQGAGGEQGRCTQVRGKRGFSAEE